MSPFNCFSSTSHDDTLPRHYNSSALPQLAASTRSRSTPSPARTPSKRPSLRLKRPSNASDRPSRPVNKRMISNPSGFQHVGGAGIATQSLPSPPLPPVPPLFSEMTENKLSSNSPSSTPPPRPPRERPYSLPASPKPLGDASNRSSPASTHAERLARRQSLAPPPKRKPAPPVTASIIKQAGGPELVSQSGAVPSLLKHQGKGKQEMLEIEEIFSKSELRMIEKYEEVGKDSTSLIGGGKGGQETDTMKWKGAMKEIEQALKQ